MLERLTNVAKSVVGNSYSPYSNFRVAAALVTEKGEIFSGVNVENASYGITICAERNAIFSAITKGSRTIDTIVIYVPGDQPVAPCGACRQVIREFSNHARVVSVCDADKVFDTSIDELLPYPFSI